MGGLNAGDTAWMLVSTALVMVMLPGLALFYGGLVRRKNVLSTIMHSFFGLALVSVIWVLVGFSLAFGHDVTGIGLLGGADYLGFSNVGLEPSTVYGTTIPFVLFAAFQLMFAAITPALITGAFAERKRFSAFVLFTIMWSILVYSPLAHWVWSSDGWLFQLGALVGPVQAGGDQDRDFAARDAGSFQDLQHRPQDHFVGHGPRDIANDNAGILAAFGHF